MKIVILIILTLTINGVKAQQLNKSYRTVAERSQGLHYLIFTDKSNCKIVFPPTSHGHAMFPQTPGYNLKYQIDHDTITIFGLPVDSTNLVLNRILESKFILANDETLFDSISGYKYVNKDLVSDKYTVFAIYGRIYRQKTSKMDSYGLINKSVKLSRRIKRKLKGVNENNHSLNTLTGKEAYDKYGLVGMNGVIEIEKR